MSIFEDRPYIQKQDQPAPKPQARVSRYRAGQAPKWGDNQDEEEEEQVEIKKEPIKVERKTDRRLERLQGGAANVNKEEAIRRRRDREVVAEIVSVAKKEEDADGEDEERPRVRRPTGDVMDDLVAIKAELPDDDEADAEADEDDADARRERARQQYLKKKSEEEAMPAVPVEEEEEEEEESGSEYETDSDYDEFHNRPTIQPVFVRKQDRETIAERDKQIDEEIKLQEMREQQIEERKQESKKLQKELVLREKIEQRNLEEGADMDERIESDEEEEDEAKEFEQWKLRELERIKRDKEEREAAEKDREETERRRTMTDQEILILDAEKFKKEKKQLKFMQKYYHKGAFFSTGDEKEIQNMDFSEPTGEDLINKESLPKIMQVKNFGRSGRTKYTHLTDQDTTFFIPDAARQPPQQGDKPVYREKPLWGHDDEFQKKLGGLHGGFQRPALKKQRSDDVK